MGELATSFDLDGSGKRGVATLLALSANLDASNRGWANVANVGKWEGHHSGNVVEFTRETLANIVANFDKRATPVKFDYEHQSRRFKGTGPVPASGHIVKLELRAGGDELWAFVEWTPTAADMIRKREYTQCSAVVAPDSVDRVTGASIGPELIEAALTDDPFIDGLHAIQLTRSPMAAADDKTKKPDAPADAAPAVEPKEPIAASAANPAPTSGNPADLAATPAVPAGDDGAADANAAVDLLAKAVGCDKTKVIAAMMDKADDFVALLQKSVPTDGMPAQMSAAAPAATTPATRAAPSDADKATAIELKLKDKRIAELTAKVDELQTGGVTADEKAASEKSERIKAHVAELTAKGHIGDGAEDQADALFMFGNDYARAERVYAPQKVPVGVSQASASAAKPEQKRASAMVVELSALSPEERATVECMAGAGISERDAVAKVVDLRAGKGN